MLFSIEFALRFFSRKIDDLKVQLVAILIFIGSLAQAAVLTCKETKESEKKMLAVEYYVWKLQRTKMKLK